jgi:hypothetical protein
MRKKIWIVVGILVAIPVLLVAGVAIFIDPIVKTGVEKGGSAVLKVPVRLDRASIRWSGRATLAGFQIGNPAGFTEPQSVAFDRIDVAVGPADLFKEVIHVGEISIVKPDLTLEFSGTKNNLSALSDNLSGGKSTAEPGKPAEKPADKAAEKPAGKKFLVQKLRVEEGTVRFKSDLLPGGAKSVTLPSVELENIGTAEGGATLGDILQKVLDAMTGAALKAGEGVLPPGLLDSLRSGLKDIPTRTVEEFKKQAEELKSKDLDPAELQKKLPGKKKTAD